MLPKGAYYRYLNTGGTNLFMVRAGTGARGGQDGDARLAPGGQPLGGNTAENHHVDGVAIPGTSFGA